MLYIIIVLVVVLTALLGAPIFSVMALLGIANFSRSDTSLMVVPQEFAKIANTQLLHSIPLFTFAGYMLAHSKASTRLVRLTKAAFGSIPGGLGIVTILVCSLFTAFTGASGVTIVALGGLLLPALLKERYGEKYSLGLVTASGSFGLLFPPSLPVILFGVLAGTLVGGVTIENLFIAGFVPGFFLILILSLHAMYMGHKYKVEKVKFSWKEVWSALLDAKFEVLLPVLLFTGIFTGVLAISDAPAFTVAYVLLTELVYHRDLRFKDLPGIMKESMTLVGAILIIMGVSFATTNYIMYTEVPQRLFETIQVFITNKWLFLILLNIFLLIVGCIMDIFSAIVVVLPLILPVAELYNINIYHLGIVFLTNLQIGYITPPVGMNLFIASIRFKRPVLLLYRSALIFIGLLIGALAVITYVPGLSLWFIEKPSIAGKWQYQSAGITDQIALKAGGRFVRKQGDMISFMMAEPETGTYTFEKNRLVLTGNDYVESYYCEIYNDGRKLLLIQEVDESETGTGDEYYDEFVNDSSTNVDDFSDVYDEDYSYEDEYTDEYDYDYDIDDDFEEGPADGRMFYENLVGQPIRENSGKFIGRWESSDGVLEFQFNGEVVVSAGDVEQRLRYQVVNSRKIILANYLDENIVEEKWDYSFEDEESLLLEYDKTRYDLVLTDSSSDL